MNDDFKIIFIFQMILFISGGLLGGDQMIE